MVSPPTGPAEPPDIPAPAGLRAGISDELVRARTGKAWTQWLSLLDRAGGQWMSHKDLVEFLAEEHDLGPWWRQMVSTGYEQAIGTRLGARGPAGYTISASRVVDAPPATVYQAWSDGRRRARWLPGVRVKLSGGTRNRTLRLVWPDGTRVGVRLTARRDGRSRVSVEHRRLRHATAALEAKRFWTDRLAGLARLLQGGAR